MFGYGEQEEDVFLTPTSCKGKISFLLYYLKQRWSL